MGGILSDWCCLPPQRSETLGNHRVRGAALHCPRSPWSGPNTPLCFCRKLGSMQSRRPSTCLTPGPSSTWRTLPRNAPHVTGQYLVYRHYMTPVHKESLGFGSSFCLKSVRLKHPWRSRKREYNNNNISQYLSIYACLRHCAWSHLILTVCI